MSNIFRTAALTLRPHISDTHELLAAADAVVGLVEREVASATKAEPIPHEILVNVARDNHDVMEAVRKGDRLGAIAALRNLFRPSGTDENGLFLRPLVGLKAAKEALEDSSFEAEFGIDHRDPWRLPEPPF